MKACIKCKEIKHLESFSRDKRNSSGFQSSCKVCYREYYLANQKKRNEKQKDYYSKNRVKILEEKSLYYSKNKKEKREYDVIYNAKNKEKIREKKRLYQRTRRRENIQCKLRHNLRRRLHHALRGAFKTGSAVRDLGCSISEFKTYLESKFQPGMSWETYGRIGWHIDHMIPLASFDLTDRGELLKATHYTNLQPLWAVDNLLKGANV